MKSLSEKLTSWPHITKYEIKQKILSNHYSLNPLLTDHLYLVCMAKISI